MKPLLTLRNFRKQAGLTHREIAEKMGIHRVKYTKVELGYQKPDLEFIRAFIDAFRATPEDVQRIFITPEGSESETKPTGTEG